MDALWTAAGWIVVGLFGLAVGYARSESFRDLLARMKARQEGKPVPPLAEPWNAALGLRWGGPSEEAQGPDGANTPESRRES